VVDQRNLSAGKELATTVDAQLRNQGNTAGLRAEIVGFAAVVIA
jgi:hypothetical protein